MTAELHHFLGVTGGTEPTAPAAEGQQVFMVTIRTTDPGEPFLEIAAFQISADNIADHAAQKTVLLDKPLFVMDREIDKMPLQHTPQW